MSTEQTRRRQLRGFSGHSPKPEGSGMLWAGMLCGEAHGPASAPTGWRTQGPSPAGHVSQQKADAEPADSALVGQSQGRVPALCLLSNNWGPCRPPKRAAAEWVPQGTHSYDTSRRTLALVNTTKGRAACSWLPCSSTF